MKIKLRTIAKKKRDAISKNDINQKFFEKKAYTYLDKILYQKKKIKTVGLYYPFKNEISPFMFIDYFKKNNMVISLPVVDKLNKSMIFKKWNLEDELNIGHLGNFEPFDKKETVYPRVLIVPLLMFDRELNRLGYGGGYYDKTINFLKGHFEREKQFFISIGLAYSKQEIKSIPCDKHDEKLDYVITEKELITRVN